MPRIGLVIGTFRSIPYIHLGLESVRRFNPDVHVFINDDGSTDPRLPELCHKYNATFHSNLPRLGWLPGDLSAFRNGLEWAQRCKLDILVKFSRRWVPTTNWTDSLIKLAKESDSKTFCNIDRNLKWGFRSEVVGMDVKEWGKLIPQLSANIEIGRKVFVEGFIHNLSKSITKSDKFIQWFNSLDYSDCSFYPDGFAPWDHIGENRIITNPQALWHHSSTPIDYYLKSKEWGLPYDVTSFDDTLDWLGH